MTDSTPHHRDADDAHADDGAPTDAVSDEVKTDAALAETDLAGSDDDPDLPEEPALTHP
ncbi:hypothetical protein [Microbacterium sp. cf332]|uniref:hypothetical protein n=1 Tax=Microbacterium sp. cf332 TaxID=1761804 RepID=UPI000885345D|nr:hypothetical protein [Microbacterium sp. cf332]SDQ16666.1 hypothetical protein SAMN04487847_0695 [Microbacterium sp. cf332]